MANMSSLTELEENSGPEGIKAVWHKCRKLMGEEESKEAAQTVDYKAMLEEFGLLGGNPTQAAAELAESFDSR